MLRPSGANIRRHAFTKKVVHLWALNYPSFAVERDIEPGAGR